MIELKSSGLQDIYNNYYAIKNLVEYTKNEAVRRIAHSSEFLNTIKFPFIGELKTKNKQESLKDKFEELLQFYHETTILSIVAEFERLVFVRVNSTSMLIQQVVNVNYINGEPMHSFRESFVKTEIDIFNLSGFNTFLEKHITEREILKEIIDYRNYLAHGKRIKVGKPSNFTLEQIIKHLDDILALL